MSLIAVGVVSAAVAAFVLTAYVRRWQWTGFTQTPGDTAAHETKTLWDWLQLLIIPAGLAVVIFALNGAQSRREKRQENRRADRQQTIADDARRDETLRVYLEQMSSLMRSRGGLDARSSTGTVGRTVARTLTLTVLRRLDSHRKGLVVRFLAEAGLVRTGTLRIDLANADLHGIRLRELSAVDLSGANLRDVDFNRAVLSRVQFNGADLTGADFRGAFLEEPQFVHANATRAKFNGAFLMLADFDAACVNGTRFDRASFFAGSFRGTAGHGASFAGVVLSPRHVDFAGHGMTGVQIDAPLVGLDGEPVRFPKRGGRCERRSGASVAPTGASDTHPISGRESASGLGTRALPAELIGTWISVDRTDDAELVYVFRRDGTYRHVGVLVQGRSGSLFRFEIRAEGNVTLRGHRLVLRPRRGTTELEDPTKPSADFHRRISTTPEQFEWSVGARGKLALKSESGVVVDYEPR